MFPWLNDEKKNLEHKGLNVHVSMIFFNTIDYINAVHI